MCGAETGTLRKLEMWCWGRAEKINWTDRVRHKEVVQNVEEQRNVLHQIEIEKG